MPFETLAWKDGAVVLLDQRHLPGREEYLTLRTPQEVADAIRNMVVRGAPAIGVTAAMGLALGAQGIEAKSVAEFTARFEDLCALFQATRPTARNLFWAIERQRDLVRRQRSKAPHEIAALLVAEAQRMKEEDIRACRDLGRHGAELLGADSKVLTHCNAGALATAGYGSALGVVRAAVEAGTKVAVIADDTRPFLQGARLTAWELLRDGINTTVITESMAGPLMRSGDVDLVVVGADRIAANGDTANKIGTYTVAVLAHEHKIPFYVAAPVSTIDLATPSGDQIPIEERHHREVTHIGSARLTPEGALIRNLAFDVTPHRYITGIITERGIYEAPYGESLRKAVEASA
jgi:methylthioribose-1-phosphate isomerase